VRLSTDADDDLVEMPDVVAAGPLALEPANEIMTELESPTPQASEETRIPRSKSISSTRRRLNGNRK
jgi:hypothetical protein